MRMDPKCNGKLILTNEELDGINEMKMMNQEYLESGKGSKSVRSFLAKAGEDDELLLRFLKGRKSRPKHAWETVKRNGEVRFDDYPKLFPPVLPKEALPLVENHVVGVLKARDSKGRLIMFFNTREWDTEKYSIELLTILIIFCIERILLDKDGLNNGVILLQENSGLGWKHAKEYTLPAMLRCLNVFYFAYPMKVKGVYFLNFPNFLTFLYGLIKPFFPKKFKDRFLLTSSAKKFEDVHEILSPDILPKFLGGKLELHEAVDKDIFNFH